MSGYSLGIDLGTTYSAAAISRNGQTSIVELGSRSASIPSVAFLRDDEEMLVGEAAHRRATAEPRRVAREFKRRIGDPTPLLLGGASFSAEALTARLLAAIVDQVVEREGEWPDSIAITHPANWGPYKIDLLQQAIRLAGIDDGRAPVTLTTEPEAAVRHYAANARVEAGSVIAVYDLGGGTFDAALLRKGEGTSFEPLGRPEGIERLGGIDFDAAVLGHVVRSLDGMVEALDDEDPSTLQALDRLRTECVDAKEALSADTETSIPVFLPNVQTEVRLTRAEFEAMIRPSLADSLAAMQRALASADVAPDEVSAVLLVGGSSRVPLVAQLVSSEFGRPVAIDADPKHAIALGAAIVASEHTAGAVATPGDAALAAAAGAVGVAAAVDSDTTPAAPEATEPVAIPAQPPTEPIDTAATTVLPAATPAPPPGTPSAPTAESGGGPSKLPLYGGIAAAVAALAVTGVIVLGGSGGGDSPEADAASDPVPVVEEPAEETTDDLVVDEEPETTEAPATTTAEIEESTATDEPGAGGNVEDTESADAVDEVEATATTAEPETTAAPTTTIDPATLPTECPTGPPAVGCITDISIDADGGIVAGWETFGFTPELEPIGDHLHFYFDSVIDGDEVNAGSAGSGGDWRLWDAPNPFTATGGDQGRTGYTIGDAQLLGATSLCVLVADVNHAVYEGTGNCIAIPES